MKKSSNLLMIGGLIALGVFLAKKKAAAAPAPAPAPAATGNYVLV